MKIAFVNDSNEHLGIGYISAVLKAKGYDVKLFVDPQLFNDEIIGLKSLSRFFDYGKRIVAQLKAYKPDLIGISIDTAFYKRACQIAGLIKQEINVPIIFGGIHPSSASEEVIKNDFVDMVCVGEGEYPMLELVGSMEEGAVDLNIKNIWFKRGKKIIRNGVRPLIEDLDSLPFADHELYYESSPHFTKEYYIIASRGCPYACSYCCHSYLRRLYRGKGKYLRQRSVENVIAELIEAKNKYNIDTIMFADDCFGCDINWLREFSYEYGRKIKIGFWCNMHPGHVSSESARYLKEAGARQIDLGIQSWNENKRKHVLNRDVSNDVMMDAMKIIKKEKIELNVDNILCLPGEKEEDIINAVSVYNYIRPSRANFTILTYYPGTAITEEKKDSDFPNASRYEGYLDSAARGYISFGGNNKKNLAKFYFLFALTEFLPKRITQFIIKKRLYRYFPAFINSSILVVLRNIFNFDLDSRILRAKAVCRYYYFIKKHFLPIVSCVGK